MLHENDMASICKYICKGSHTTLTFLFFLSGLRPSSVSRIRDFLLVCVKPLPASVSVCHGVCTCVVTTHMRPTSVVKNVHVFPDTRPGGSHVCPHVIDTDEIVRTRVHEMAA